MALSTDSLAPTGTPETIPDFETLVRHMLAAKRSLSCLEHVSHANHLVTNTRQALEAQTVLSARTDFLTSGCFAQTRVLEQVRDHMQGVAHDSAAEFSNVITSLDAADSQLKNTIAQLKETLVESSLRPSGEEQKTLIDFVDESGPETLLDTIKSSIDASGQSRGEYEEAIHSLDDEILEVTELLAPRSKTARAADLRDEGTSMIPDLLHSMEEAAEEMANNLESLVKHFDLCVNAIKHSEGGTAAASGIIRDLPDSASLHLSHMDGAAEPISDEEKKEMLEVIQKDAMEVDEVVSEIKQRITEMEFSFEQVTEHGEVLEESFGQTVVALKLLDEVGNRLPGYLARGQIFIFRWDDDKAKIGEHLAELQALNEVYESFLVAYDELLIEVGRRKNSESKIRDICRKALAQINDVREQESQEREHFRRSQGEFLPADIWSGLSSQPPRYEIAIVEGEADDVPDIAASVINKAIRRTRKSKGVH